MGNVKIVAASILFVFSANGYCGTMADVAKAVAGMSALKGVAQTNYQLDDNNRATQTHTHTHTPIPTAADSGRSGCSVVGRNDVGYNGADKYNILILPNNMAQMSNCCAARGGCAAQSGGNFYLKK